MRGLRKRASKFACAMLCACALCTAIVPIKNNPKPVIVKAESEKKPNQAFINLLIAMMMGQNWTFTGVGQNASNLFNAINGAIAMYNEAKTVDWESVNEGVEIKNGFIRVGQKTYNCAVDIMSWIKNKYDLTKANHTYPFQSILGDYAIINADTLTFVINRKDNVQEYVSSSVKTRFVIAKCQGSYGSLMVAKQNFGWKHKFSDGGDMTGNSNRIMVDNIDYYYWWNRFLSAELDVGVSVPTIETDFDSISSLIASIYGVGSSPSTNIDAIPVGSIKDVPKPIDAGKAGLIDLSGMRNIDVWKDQIINSVDDFKDAIIKSIANPVSIDVNGGVSVPVAYPIEGENDIGLKVPVVTEKVIDDSEPIPTTKPTTTSEPTSKPTEVPNPTTVPEQTAMPVDPVVPDNPNDFKLPDLKGIFPFSVPWDLYGAFKLLDAEPVAPKFTLTGFGKDWDFDLSFLSAYMKPIRAVITLCFIISLIFITRYIAGGQ